MRFAGNIAYGFQQAEFDSRQRHVLQGRERLLSELAPAPGSRVAELGAGCGDMIDLWGTQLRSFAALELVETDPAMLRESRRRARRHPNVRVIAADATSYRTPWLADCVYFSYALTRIPDWVRALNNALAMLKPGGKLGIVDFYVSSQDLANGRAQHNALMRWFWVQWFALEQLHLSDDHLSALFTLTDRPQLHEGVSSLPNMPLLKAPFYVFTGVKPDDSRSTAMCELWKKSAHKK